VPPQQFPSFGGVPPQAAGWSPRSNAAAGGEPRSPGRNAPVTQNNDMKAIINERKNN